ncbi:MAG: S8 family serine peptidase [Myxococcales bacterium]|nr:S8 family serine peptidase [Myxococcales bacterium]
MRAKVTTARRWLAGCGLPLGRACSAVVGLGLVMGLLACSERAAVPEQQRPHPEELVPGHLLVELRRGERLPVRSQPSLPSTNTVLRPQVEEQAQVSLGGEPLQVVRELFPEPGPGSLLLDKDPQAGAIVLLLRAEADEPTTRKLLAKVAQDPLVRRVEPDRVRYATAIPNDPLYSSQWALPLIRMPRAWDITRGSEEVVVAVLDTGIVLNHPDLQARLIPGYDFISRPDSADDGDRIRDSDPTDTGTVDSSRLHGSHVSGIIGAVTGNAVGIAGIDQKCRLLPVRVLGVRSGDGIDSDISDALRWVTGAQLGTIPVVSRRVDVINLSFGGPGLSFTLQRAIDEVVAAGLLVVVAAGNGGAEATTYSPGGLDGVISVGASDAMGRRAVYSNYGPRVDLLAPGGGLSEWDYESDLSSQLPDGILSTYRDEGIADPKHPPFTYSPLTGTSQAAPHVAGAAALVRALLPNVRQRTLGLLLRTAADSRYRCPADELTGCGAGLLDVESLLTLAQLQKRCGCQDDLFCIDGMCLTPPQVHDSVWDRPLVRGGYCQLASDKNQSSATSESHGYWLGLGMLVLLGLFRVKARPQA